MPPPAHTPAPAAVRAPPAPPSLPGDFQDAAAAIERRLVDVEQYQVPQLAECRGPISFHNELATAVRQELARARRDLDELKVEADDLDRAKERAAASQLIASIQQRLDSCTRAYRQAVVASKRQIDASAHLVAREELFASTSGRGSPAPGASGGGARAKSPMPGPGGDNALMQATSDVTEGLRRTLQLMQQEVDRSMVSNELLESQTQTMQLTSNRYSTLSSLMNTSKTLITTLERSNILDRLVLFGAFAFFAAVCAHIFKKRVIDRGVHVVGALGGIVAKGGGAVAGLARKAPTSQAVAEEATQVIKRGAADEWARATAAAVGAAGAVRAGIDMARSKASQVVTDRDVPTQTPALADSVRDAPAERDIFEEAVPFEEEPLIAPVEPETAVDSEPVLEEIVDSAGEPVHVFDDDMSLEESNPAAAGLDEPFKPAAVAPLDDHYEDAASDEEGYTTTAEEASDPAEREAESAFDNDDEEEEEVEQKDVDKFPEAHQAETLAPRQPHPPTPSLHDISDWAFETPSGEKTPASKPDPQAAVEDDDLSIDSGVAFGDGEGATNSGIKEESIDELGDLYDPMEEYDLEAAADHTDGATAEAGFRPDSAAMDADSDAEDFDGSSAGSETSGDNVLDSASTAAEAQSSEPLQLLDLELPTDYSDLDLDAAPAHVWPIEYGSNTQAEPLDVVEAAKEQALPRDVAGVEGTTQPLGLAAEEDAAPPLDVEETGDVPASEEKGLDGQAVTADLPIDLDAEQTIWTDNTAPEALDDVLTNSLNDATTDGGVPDEEAEQADESLLEAILEQQMGHAAGSGAFGDRLDFSDDEHHVTSTATPAQVDAEDVIPAQFDESGWELQQEGGQDLTGDDEGGYDDLDHDYGFAEPEPASAEPTYASTFAPTADPTEPATDEHPARTTQPASPSAASTVESPTAATSVDADGLPPSSAEADPFEPAEPAAPISFAKGATVPSASSSLEGYQSYDGAELNALSATEPIQTPAPSRQPVDAGQEEALSHQPELGDDLDLASAGAVPLTSTRDEVETVEYSTEQEEISRRETVERDADQQEPKNTIGAGTAAVSADDTGYSTEPVSPIAYDNEVVDESEESLQTELASDEEAGSDRSEAEPVQTTPDEEASRPAEDITENIVHDPAAEDDSIDDFEEEVAGLVHEEL